MLRLEYTMNKIMLGGSFSNKKRELLIECACTCGFAWGAVPTVVVRGAGLVPFPRFLRSSSLTGSLTLTPWYGLDADASDEAVQTTWQM